MTEIIVSWIIIFIYSLLLGNLIIMFLNLESNKFISWEMIVIMGGIGLTVYSQIFSLFYKIGVKAQFILTMVLGFLYVLIFVFNRSWYKKKFIKVFKQMQSKGVKLAVINFTLIIVLGALLASLTAVEPEHYDTYLYHAQAIRWLEEYGVVKGLGNLHNRFSYNSSFLPLQALFTFKWHLNRSLHSMNGFLSLLFVYWAISSSNILCKRKAAASDFFRLSIVIYVLSNSTYISSPATDMSPMLTVLYIFTKWVSLQEENQKYTYSKDQTEAYTLLIMMAVWGITLKLSVAAGILFAIYPILEFAKNGSWKKILKYTVVCLIIVVPWLIRNIIISGYILYPYEAIDLFNVDWKMAPSILEFDRKEIIVWGRNVKDVSLYNQSLWHWFPSWISSIGTLGMIELVLSAISFIVMLPYYLRMIIKKDIREALLYVVSLTSFLMWLFSAPLFRYGMVYSLIPICLLLSNIFCRWDVMRQYSVTTDIVVDSCFLLVGLMLVLKVRIDAPTIYAEDYRHCSASSVVWNGIDMFYPLDTDQLGYYAFPGTPYINILDNIDMRGENIEDGFRLKQELQDEHLCTYGTIW